MRTPEDLWQALVEEAGEDAITAAAGVSPSQAEDFLAAAGFSVREERALGDQRIAELMGAGVTGPVPHDPAPEVVGWVRVAAPAAKRRAASRWVPLLAAALAAAATARGILYAVGHRSNPPDRPVEPPREAPTASPPPVPAPPSPSETPLPPAPRASDKPRAPRPEIK